MSSTGKVSVELGNYGNANCYWAPCGDIPDKTVGSFSPFLKVFKQNGVYELHVVLFAPCGYQLDANKPIVLDYLGKDLFLFFNFKEDPNGPGDGWEYFITRVHFNSDFSPKLKGKNIFVIPVHGDPEEGDVNKVIVEDEDEID